MSLEFVTSQKGKPMLVRDGYLFLQERIDEQKADGDVINAFDQLSDHLPAEVQPVIDYFEDTWIGRLNRRGRRGQPMFALQMWNCYESVLDGLPKTNNSVEGWHCGFLELIGAHYPIIFKFINALKKEQSLNETKIEQYIAGQAPPLGRLGRFRFRGTGGTPDDLREIIGMTSEMFRRVFQYFRRRC